MLKKLNNIDLPIKQHLSSIVEKLSQNQNLILQAEPGAGKTTLVPLALLEVIPKNKKIIMLEPRRLATRSAALRMADILEEPIARTVGYRIKNETKVSAITRIEVITEGILIRMLQSDPELTSVGLIIFDEFHQRSLDADLGLALALEVQQNLRDDLKIVIMSATLNIEKIALLLIDAPIINVTGRSYPVSINYMPAKAKHDWFQALLVALNQAFQLTDKDILVFLPGLAEINKVSELLKDKFNHQTNLVVLPLYGELPLAQQLIAITPIKLKQKIILATNIAETSITIEGVNCVIDSGLVRLSEFDPNVGFDRLHTKRISLDSATQRTGRAGRLAAGICFRLWAESENLRAETPPEILRADLAGFNLELALWGVKSPTELGLIDQPNLGAYQQASALLMSLGAVNQNNRVLEHGANILKVGIHPRIGHMLLKSISMGALNIALIIAVLLEEKDILKGEQRFNPDFLYRLELIVNSKNSSHSNKSNKSYQLILQQANQLRTNLQRTIDTISNTQKSITECLFFAPCLLAMVFPDRIAKKRGKGYLLANGTGALLNDDYSFNCDYLVVIKVGGSSGSSKIYQAIEISRDEIDQLYADIYIKEERVYWDEKTLSVKAESQTKLVELILSKEAVPTQVIQSTNPDLLVKGLLLGIKAQGLNCLPWTGQLKQWQAKVQMLFALQNEQFDFPDFSEANLLATIEFWLTPYLDGIYKLNQISDNLLSQALKNRLNWQQQTQLEQLMPSFITLASGTKINLDYCLGDKPVLEVKLQQMFGEVTSPTVANGLIAVVIHLLSPARRPLQITENLTSFWNNAYIEVKKEMRGRYPKHPWPDDPLTAIPTNSVKHPRKATK